MFVLGVGAFSYPDRLKFARVVPATESLWMDVKDAGSLLDRDVL